MRKLLTTLYLVLVLSIGTVNKANALIIDPTSLAQKITEWVGKITDATHRIQQQIEQMEQLSLQGFAKDFIAGGAAEAYFEKYAGGYLKNQFEKRLEKTSKAKEQKNLETAQVFHTETSQQYYTARREEAIKNQENIKNTKKEYEGKLEYCGIDVMSLSNDYRALLARKADFKEIEPVKEKLDLKKSECDELRSTVEELRILETQSENDLKSIEEDLAKVGTEEDPEYKQLQMRKEALANTDETNLEIGAKDSSDEWDTNGIVNKYTITPAEYKEFINKYFINDKNISESQISSQTEMDRVMRDRRNLLINSAIHLLQVTATLRREIPTKTEKIKDLYDEVPSAENEAKALSYFSASKLDNIRALHLYAKVLTTKLQYLAAKDLLIIEPRRRISADNVDAEAFDLSKYKLTQGYLEAIEDESNKGIDLHQGISGN